MTQLIINLFLFLSFVLDIFLVSFITLKSSKKESDYAFASSTLCVGLWTLGILMFRLSNVNSVIWFWNCESIFTSGLIASTFLHFSLCLTGKKLTLGQKTLLHLPNLFIFIALFMPDAFIKGIVVNSWGKESVLGYLYPLFGLYFSLYVIYALYRIFSAFQTASGNFKTQLAYILTATLLTSIVGSYFNLYLILAGNYRYIWIGPYNSLILVIVIAYAITKHHLMEISVIINRVAAEIIAALFFIVGYLTVFGLYQTYVSHAPNYLFAGWNVLYGILVFYTFSKLRFFIQTSSEKVFLRGKYNYYRELAKISDQITRNFSQENVLAALHNAFYDVVEASNPKIYLPKDFDKPEAKELLPIKKLCFKGEDLILPCLFEGKTMALIVLGSKFSEDAYSDEDLRLLTNLASQTAVALDHCQLCEEMLGAQKQLLMADKLSSMGKVAAGLAHEIKNPLTAIKGMTQALERNPEDQETIRDFNAIIPKEVDRLTRLVEGLSNLGKTPKFQITKVNINTLLENNLKLFESRCRKQGINIIKDLGTLPEIETDGERLTQVFTNLSLNAIQAMPDGGKLEIRTQKIEHGTTVEIADTGQGIPEDKLKDIFEPFFTTKEEGTGLGLAITHKIIKDIKGEIKVESEVGKGTKFRIELPVG